MAEPWYEPVKWREAQDGMAFMLGRLQHMSCKNHGSEVLMEQGGGEEGVPDTAFPFWMRSSLPWLPWLFFPQSFGEALPDSTYHIHGYPSSVQQLQGFL